MNGARPHAVPLAPPTAPPAQPPLRLSTGYPELDDLRAFEPGRFVLLHHPPPRAYYRLLATAAQQAPALVVEGGNSFSAIRLQQEARALRIPDDTILDGVMIVRAFTCYQLDKLLRSTVPLLVGEGVRLVVAAELAAQYADPDRPKLEARTLYEHALADLGRVARAQGALVLVTDHGTMPTRPGFLEAASQAVDEALEFTPRPGGAVGLHAKRSGIRMVCQPGAAAQRGLREWGAA